MPRKLLGILLCLVLANVVNYFANEWLDQRIPGWLPATLTYDGSSLTSSLAHSAADTGAYILPASPGLDVMLPAYYRYLDTGGGEAWLEWRSSYDQLYGKVVTTVSAESGHRWRSQLLTFLDRTAVSKYGSLLLLGLTILLFFGGWLKEQYWWTPIYYLAAVSTTAALYTGFAAPLFVLLVAGGFLVYALALRFTLPIYTYEWTKSLRPFLTLVFFLLAMMSVRGPEWIDYLFWTSDLYRLTWLSVLLLSLFFHWVLLDKALDNAELSDVSVKISGYAMPLGILAIFIGLAFGFYFVSEENALVVLNRELLLFSPEVADTFSVKGFFVLFFAGVTLLILGGIGYFIQRIAK